ncbi:hypothetical protein D7X55_20905 [Corallococcus sp. AB049A]|uniref:DUF4177 domain-containing protein n=1 Tax=Corallococcus interemptor TaxID=2316720 RepID=A0A3A8PXP2_9BACT|nr:MULTISPECIES: hypothetical protein [Corallococcus]RKH43631.1 hypothetical protein D7Y23_28945 [Corallococcus sp. AB050B]RKH61189.1 hypothetical protein D7X96_32125 [Corallococcus interemptor]RKI63141.1 hypothetical protein D7X55_20905 [Corallococcus sp. AB049A]
MNRRLASLVVLPGVLLGAAAISLMPSAAWAQTSRTRAAPQKEAPPPPAPPPATAYEYTFVKREGPDEDLAELQRLGAEGWRVVSTVVVDGSTRRYVLMRDRRAEPTPRAP